MKHRKLLGLAALAAGILLTACTGDRKADIELPAETRTFVDNLFNEPEYRAIEIDNRYDDGTWYYIALKDGSEITVNSDGDWRQVYCSKGDVPTQIVPLEIQQYIVANYAPSLVITGIERTAGGDYMVDITERQRLLFDKAGNPRPAR